MLIYFKSSWICEKSAGLKDVHKVEKKFSDFVASNKVHAFPKSLEIWKKHWFIFCKFGQSSWISTVFC